jgi:hypothetical protein
MDPHSDTPLPTPTPTGPSSSVKRQTSMLYTVADKWQTYGFNKNGDDTRYFSRECHYLKQNTRGQQTTLFAKTPSAGLSL